MSARLIHLLRHGAPKTPGLLMGRSDGVPTQAGIASCLAQVAGLDPDRIVSSDRIRARRAAEAIGQRQGVPVTVDPRWREVDFGDWDGLPPAAIAPAALARFRDDPDANPPPGGERWSALVHRVADAIAAQQHGETVLIVTHGGAMRAALAHLCGFAVSQLWSFDLSYGALLSLRVWPGPQPGAQIIGLRP